MDHFKKKCFFILSVLLSIQYVYADDMKDSSTVDEILNKNTLDTHRKSKLFPIFQIVTFPNDACVGSSRNGTCYTAEECTNRGGTSDGTCANSYGICCTFSKSCGQTSTENCTYFTAPTVTTGMLDCSLEICPCNNNICQLRLDFNTFVITGPSTDTNSVGTYLFGQSIDGTNANPPNMAAEEYSLAGQCLTDTFAVTNPGGNSPPVICGVNTGEHMYVDSSSSCNDLNFQFFDTATGNALANRNFEIKVTQYSCDYNNLAPPGCTQYYFGPNSGEIQTFNFDGTPQHHLANQNQNICIRREIGFCQVCFTATTDTDFAVSGNQASSAVTNAQICCGYGRAGQNARGFDCAIIVGASATTGMDAPSRICGNVGLLKSSLDAISNTVCTSSNPFNVHFISDAYETVAEGSYTPNNAGFRLAYVMDTENCIAQTA